MNVLSYAKLVSQFFFRKTHTFTVRLGNANLTVKIEQEVANAVHVPFAVSFSSALNLVSLIEDHAPVRVFRAPISFVAYIDGNIEVTVTVSKV